MGIKNLSQFLKKREVHETINISNLKYTKIAIDTPMFFFKFKGVTDPSTNDWLGCFISLVAFLRKCDVHPVFIFEGKSPPEKASAQEERREQRQKMVSKTTDLENDLKVYTTAGKVSDLLAETWEKIKLKNNKSLLAKKTLIKSAKSFVDIQAIKEEINKRKRYEINITSDDINNLKELFDIMGVSWIASQGEAETDCVTLLYDGIVDYIVSEDTDVLAYYNPKNEEKDLKVITNFNTSDFTFTQISKNKVLETLNLTSKSFRDLCIMCGTDYNENIPRVGVETSYKYITKYYNLENIPVDTTILNYPRGRELFEVKSNPFLHSLVRWCRIPQNTFIDDLSVFMFTFNLRNINVQNIFKALSEADILSSF